jgi:hypothetical protein
MVCYASGSEAGGKSVAENRILEILPDGSTGAIAVGETVEALLHSDGAGRFASIAHVGDARDTSGCEQHYQLRPGEVVLEGVRIKQSDSFAIQHACGIH